MATAAELQILLSLRDSASQGLKDAGANVDGFGSKIKSLLAPMAGLAAGFLSFKTLESAIATTQKLGAEVGKLSRETGLGAEDASRLLAVFKRFGQDGDDASRSLGIFSKNLTIAHEETLGFTTSATTTQKLFQSLGISAETAGGQIRPVSDVLLDVADKFKGMQNGAEKTGLAMQLFGKSGKDMIPILNQGRDGIIELEKEADRLGLVLTSKNIDAIKQYTVSQRTMNEALNGLKLQIGLEVMPALTKLANWFSDHQEDIRKFVSEALDQIGHFAADVVSGLGLVQSAFQWIPDNQLIIIGAFVAIGAAAIAAMGPITALLAGVTLALKLAGQLSHAKADNELSSLQSERADLLKNFDQANVRLGNEAPVGGGTLRDQLLAQRGQVDIPAETQKLADYGDRIKAIDDRIAFLTKGGEELGAVAGAAVPPVVKLREGLTALPPKADAAKEKVDKLAEAMLKMRDSIDSAIDDGIVSFQEFTNINKQALKDGLEPLTAAFAGHLEASKLLALATNGNAEEAFNLTKNLTKMQDVLKTSGVEAVKLGVTFAQDVVGKIKTAFSSLFGAPTKEEATLDLQIAEVQRRIAGFNAAAGGQDISNALKPDEALLASLQKQRDLMSANNDVMQKQFALSNAELLTNTVRDQQAKQLIEDQRQTSTWVSQVTTDYQRMSPEVQAVTRAMSDWRQYLQTLMSGGANDLRLAARGV